MKFEIYSLELGFCIYIYNEMLKERHNSLVLSNILRLLGKYKYNCIEYVILM